MFRQIQQIFALVVPEGTNPHIRFCGARVICLVMVWFFIQGSGSVVTNTAIYGHTLQAAIDLGLLNLGAQCVGGIIGSIIVLFRRSERTATEDGKLPRFDPSRLWPLVCAAVLALTLVANFVCAAANLALLSTIIRMVGCSIVTILFLEACLTLAKWSPRTALSVFFLISLCRIVQSLITLPFEMGLLWAALSLVIELALVVAYVLLLARQPVEPADEPEPLEQKGPAEAPDAAAGESEGDRYLPWQFIVHVMLYYFVIGVLRLQGVGMAAPGLQTNCTYLLASVAAFGLFYASFVRTGNTSTYWVRIRQIAFPLLIASCLLAGLLPAGLLFLALILSQTAYRFYLLSSYVEMFSICDITNVNTRHVFAVTHLVMYVGMLAGGILGIETQATATTPHTVITTTLLLFLCLIAASCWLGNDKSAGKVWGRRIELTPKGRHDELYAETCQIIAERFGLTAKETEILEHLVRKESLDQIAAALTVSKNTVRTHVRNLYAKVDAHSQSDIYLLFDETKNEARER